MQVASPVILEIAKLLRLLNWPSLKKDVAKLVGRCHTCQLAKH